jgi:hypothetical protein
MTQFPNVTKLTWALVLAGLIASPTAAQQAPSPPAPPLAALLECRARTEDAARLACFDAAAAAFGKAAENGDLMVVDRAQIERARQEAFGFRLPALTLLDREGEEAPQSRVAMVRSVRVANDGGLLIELDDGAVWRQTDQRTLGRRPRPGSKAEIRRGALNSYFMSLDGQPSLRARRVE